MTRPNPDAELDKALGVDQLPPAAVTEADRAEAHRIWDEALCNSGVPGWDRLAVLAQALADAEQRAVARYIAACAAAGVQLDGRRLAAREDYGELTRAAEHHLARCEAARADQTATGLPFAVGEARRRLSP